MEVSTDIMTLINFSQR